MGCVVSYLRAEAGTPVVSSEEVGIGQGTPRQAGASLSNYGVGDSGRGHCRTKDLALVPLLSHRVLGLSFPILVGGFGTYLSGVPWSKRWSLSAQCSARQNQHC